MRVFPGWWQVLAALILNAASSAAVFTSYSIIAVPLDAEFAPSRTMLMMGITLAALAAGTLGAPVGAAIDKFSVKLLMLGGTAMLGSGFFLLSLAQSMNHVLLIYFLVLSVGSILTGPMAGAALLSRWFSRRRGLAISICGAGAALGGIIFPNLLQFLIETFEWRTALQIFGIGLFLATGPIVALLVINRPADKNLYPDGDLEPPPEVSNAAHAKAGSMMVFLRKKNFWLIAIILGLLLGGPMGLISNMVPFLMERGIEASQGALLISVFSTANFFGKLLSGPIADKVDHRIVLAGIALVVGLAMFAYTQVSTFMLLAIISATLGAVQGGIVPLWSLILAKMYGPDNMGRSMGLMGILIMPFTLAAAPLFGAVYDLTGSYTNGFLGYAVILVAALVLITQVREERPEEIPEAMPETA